MAYQLIFIIIAVVSYFLGAIPFALMFNKLVFKQDPREIGSKNIGALNTLRIGVQKKGKVVGLLSFLVVFLLDAGKGVLAVFLTQQFLLALNPSTNNYPYSGTDLVTISSLVALLGVTIACFFSILGHNYSAYIKFQGGRGAATLFGIMLYLSPVFALYWLLIVLTFMILGEILTGHKWNKQLIPNAISNQILGRLIGEFVGLFVIYFFEPNLFVMIAFPLFFVLFAHKDRLRQQMEKIKSKTYLPD
jgi:glycerol-3-phosphate acyltransferase PlsY